MLEGNCVRGCCFKLSIIFIKLLILGCVINFCFMCFGISISSFYSLLLILLGFLFLVNVVFFIFGIGIILVGISFFFGLGFNFEFCGFMVKLWEFVMLVLIVVMCFLEFFNLIVFLEFDCFVLDMYCFLFV